MANFDQLGLIDNFDKEYGCYRPNSERNVSDQFVLELLIGHCWEDYESDTQNCKVADESEDVSKIVEFVLNKSRFTLLLREQVSEGTKLMWLIWRAAHPKLNSEGKII